MDFYSFLVLLSVVFGLAYYFVRQKYSYWERLNIAYIEPTFPYGSLKQTGSTIHISQILQKHYNELKGRGQFAGLYMFMKPAVLATDLDFVKNILIKDFDHFDSRSEYHNEKDDPLSATLFAVEGEKWRRLRSKLTPTFTSSKMKLMHPMITDVASEFKNVINASINGDNADLEIKEFISRFTTDAIGTCAFGIECNSLKNPNSDFLKYGRAFFEKPRNSTLKRLFLSSFQEIGRKLRMKSISDDVSQFFISSLRETICYREANNVQRNDFLNLMMKLQKHEKLDGDENEDDTNKNLLSFNEAAAQCFAFFVGGYESSATTMMFCLFEMSINQDIQRKARQEIIDVLQKHNGEFTYDAIMQMHYIDLCIKEAMRKYAPVTHLIRLCTKDYQVPDTKITITKGTNVLIPVWAIHRDPDIFPEPEVYNPDRFLPEEMQKRHALSFLAFGDGQRNCIGVRFALMQARVGLATMLQNFEFTPCSRTTNPLIFSPKGVILTTLYGPILNVKAIKVDQ